MIMRSKKRLLAAGMLAVLSVSAAGCGKTEEETVTAKVAVEVQNPEIGSLSTDTTYIGTMAPEQQVYIIPKTSGTVTEVAVKVGDTVAAGDLLFKIDDEAAQLQLDSAQIQYDSAAAQVAASSGGQRHLSNYQTQTSIDSILDQMEDMDDQIDDLEDTQDSLESQKESAAAAVAAAQAAYSEAAANTAAATAALESYYTTTANAANTNIPEGSSTGSDADTGTANENTNSEGDSSGESTAATNVTDIAAAVVSGTDTTKKDDLQLALIKAQQAEALAKDNYNSALSAYSELTGSLSTVKSTIDSLESSYDTLDTSYAQASYSNQITQNEIYPEADAASATSLDAAALAIDSAQMQLDFCTVTAPIGGIVESVSVEKESMAASGSVAAIISNKDSMTVTFSVTEKAKNTLNIGDKVIVEREGGTYEGAITEIGTMANQQTKLFTVKAAVENASDKLPNGVSVKVYATTQKVEDQLIIPYDALYFSAGDAYVYCVENDVIVRKSVQVGLMSDTQAVIEEGLAAEDLIVANWSSKLRDGAEAEVVSINGEAVAGTDEAVDEATPAEEEAEETDIPEEEAAE